MSTSSHPLAPPSNALWGQLLRKNTVVAPAPLPPTVQDKTGTSMRILLHDTQANFETFSTRVDTLTSGIDNARREIVIVKDLFQGAQESLTMDIVDLVNRSQTQIQKSMGDPAQATALELFRKDVDARLDGFSTRLDDMQSFNQTQSQALQNVVQTLQSLQDQQGKILSALLPILPLLQAVPVHINSARSSINETVLKVSLESTRSHRTPPHIWPQPLQVIRKRSLPPGPPESPLLVRKRPRLDDERIETSGEYLNGSPQRASRRPGFPNNGLYFSPSGRSPVPRAAHRTTPSLPKSTTPRRPLGDLPVPENVQSKEVPYIRSPMNDAKDIVSPPANRTPLMLSTPSRSIHQLNASMPRTPPPLSSTSRVASASPPSAVMAPPTHLADGSAVPSTADNQLTTPLDTSIDLPPPPQRSEPPAPKVAAQPSAPVSTKVTMVRGRRSPFRDGRRFIPLDDSDSDSDDD